MRNFKSFVLCLVMLCSLTTSVMAQITQSNADAMKAQADIQRAIAEDYKTDARGLIDDVEDLLGDIDTLKASAQSAMIANGYSSQDILDFMVAVDTNVDNCNFNLEDAENDMTSGNLSLLYGDTYLSILYFGYHYALSDWAAAYADAEMAQEFFVYAGVYFESAYWFADSAKNSIDEATAACHEKISE